MAKTGKVQKAAEVTNMIAGAKKRFTNGSQSLPVGSITMTVDQVTAKMQTFVDNRDAVETAQAATTVKVAAEREQAPSLLAIIAAFVAFVRFTFGNAADVLADFDIPPVKVRVPLTAEAKAIAAAKAKATRAARGTTSAKAKKNVKGNVTAALVVTPATPPAPVAPAASPAPAGAAPAPTPTAHS